MPKSLFISYKREDRDTIEPLVKILEAAHYDVWFDERLYSGQDWKQELRIEIEACDGLIFAVSSLSLISDYCRWEFDTAIKSKKPVFPVKVKNLETLPKWIKSYHIQDFTKQDEKIATAQLLAAVRLTLEPKLLKEDLQKSVATYAYGKTQELNKALTKKPKEPYRLLDYFTIAERSVFFGREADQAQLLQKTCDSRFCILYASSGVGKTSLLQAGLIPDLLADDRLPVYIGVTDSNDPIEILKHVLAQRATHLDSLKQIPLHTFLTWAVEDLQNFNELVIIFDQFEQFFHSEIDEKKFRIELSKCILDNNLPIRFLIGIRKEYYSDLLFLQKEIAQLTVNNFHLKALDDSGAHQAIAEPAIKYGIHWDEDSVKRLIKYLEWGEIGTPQLQFICTQLYLRAKEEGLEKIFVTEDLDEIRSAHTEYLRRIMEEECPDEWRELGWTLLKNLVSSDRLKKTVPLTLLYENIAPGEKLRPLIDWLDNKRILRIGKDFDVMTVEVAHETLAERIIFQEKPSETLRRIVKEIVEREIARWKQNNWSPEHLIDRSTMETLNTYRDHLNKPSSVGLELLVRSALYLGYEIDYWIKRAAKSDSAQIVHPILIDRLGSLNYRERVEVINQIVKFDDDSVDLLKYHLKDKYPQVRKAVIQVLEQKQPIGEWRKYLKYECYIPKGSIGIGTDANCQAKIVSIGAFYVEKYPITYKDFQRFKSALESNKDLLLSTGSNLPITNINWQEAQDYAEWANMRLLSEREWEKSAYWVNDDHEKGLYKRDYPWGSEFDTALCNTFESSLGKTPVEQHSPRGDSWYGLAGSAGNVWEWCQDEYHYTSQIIDSSSMRFSVNDSENWNNHELDLDVALSVVDGKEIPPSIEIYGILIENFNLRELQNLCFDLGVNYDHLPGLGRVCRARELVAYFYGQRALPKLLVAIWRDRKEMDLTEILHNSSDDYRLNLPDNMAAEMPESIRANIRLMLSRYFEESELLNLSLDLYPDYDYLFGMSHGDRASELLAYMEHSGRMNDLLDEIVRLRTYIPLDDVRELEENTDTLAKIRKLFGENFSKEEMQDLCFLEGIDYEQFASPGINTLIRGLVTYSVNRRELPRLIDKVRLMKPNVVWDQILMTSGTNRSDDKWIGTERGGRLILTEIRELLESICVEWGDDWKLNLKTFCNSLDLDFENLPGERREYKLREIVLWFHRREELDRLLKELGSQGSKYHQKTMILMEMLDGTELVDRAPDDWVVANLRRILVRAFDAGELRNLAFVLNIDSENLPGSGKFDMAREIVALYQRQGRLVELVNATYQLRKGLHWWLTPEKLDKILLNIYRAQKWHEILSSQFSRDDLMQLCFQLGIDFENIPGRTNVGRVRILFDEFSRSDQLDVFLEAIYDHRPYLPWLYSPDATRLILSYTHEAEYCAPEGRVLRGGSYKDTALGVLSNARSMAKTTECYDTVGFRLGFSSVVES